MLREVKRDMDMHIEPDPEQEVNRLQDNAVLIINGLSQSGQVLAEMLAQQGADVAIVDSRSDQELIHHIRQSVRANGRRCLVLTPDRSATRTSPFSQYAIQKIVDTFGRLDAFISYSATDSSETDETGVDNGRSRKPVLFDQDGLAKAALRHILAQNHG